MSEYRKVVLSQSAPAPIPVLSQAIINNGTVYCSGQVGVDPVTMQLVDGDVQARTHQIFKNLQAVLKEAGSDLDHALKVNVYITDMANFAKVNEVYAQYFSDPKPARTCVAVHQLPLGTDVEIELTAVLIK